jgi:hypothetical protein
MLNGRSLRPLIADDHATPGLTELPCERICPVPERVRGGSLPELDDRPGRACVTHAELVKQRWAGQDCWDLVVRGNRQDRSAGDHDADHPLPQDAGSDGALAGRAGTGQRAIGDCPHGQHAADLQAQHGGSTRVDRDLARAI